MSKMELSQSPGDFLLNELIARQFRLPYFAEILRNSNELKALSCITSTPDPLSIIVQPGDDNSDINLLFGEELKLECRATEIPPPQYEWYHNNVPIDCTQPILIIPSFEPKHEGYYYCVASRYLHHEMESVISNTVVCKFIDILPVFKYRSPDLVFHRELGSKVVFSVSVKSHGQCKLQWIKHNQVIRNENSHKLILNNLQASDFSEYKCVANNSAGEVYSEVFVLKQLKKKPPTAKVALLIANEDYDNYPGLSTPCNDIILLAEKLKELNYYVIALVNLSKIEMQNVIKWFFEMLPFEADAFFSFVGHGFQLSDNKFMMPVDCPSMAEVKMADCLCDQLLIKKAKNKMLRLLVLMIDMCLKVPNSEENALIFNERPKQYKYKPCNACNVIKIFSTSSHQNAYETPNQKHGVYIEHIAKYLLKDKPIIDIFNEAHKDFENTQFFKFQKPSLAIEGGHKLKLKSKPLENLELDAKLKSISTLNKPEHKLKFPSKMVNMTVQVTPHEDTILNAVDLNFFYQLYSYKAQLNITPMVIVPKVKHTAKGTIFTLNNLQKVKQEIYISIILKNDHNNEEDSCELELGIPLIAAEDLWYQPIEEEEEEEDDL